MPGPRPALHCALFFLIATVGPPGASSEGNVGCLFSQRLCLEDVEWCHDDYAFGKCLPSTGNLDEEDLYRYDLDRPTLHSLSKELGRLFALGYRWSHSYTQCRLQGMLYALQNNVPFDQNLCFYLVDQDLEGALKALESQDQLEPEQVAIVKFTPSVRDPHPDFADEVYYPPVNDAQTNIRDIILPPNAVDIYDIPDPYTQQAINKRAWINRQSRSNSPETIEFLQNEFGIQRKRPPVDGKDPEDLYPVIDYLSKIYSAPEDEVAALIRVEALKALIRDFDQNKYDMSSVDLLKQKMEKEDLEKELTNRFTSNYNTPEGFREGWESRDLNEDLPESRVYFEDEDPPRPDHKDSDEIFRELKQLNEEDEARGNSPEGLYTEGGVVYVPDPQITELLASEAEFSADGKFKEDLDQLLQRYNLGFKRPERLDVKKPGPLFDRKQTSNDRLEEILPAVVKKEPRGVHPNPSHDFKDVNTDFVYVQFKQGISYWSQGEDFIGNITSLLHLEPRAVSDGRVDKHEVTFKVHGLNATEVAKKIGAIKEPLREATGLDVVAVGVGDRTKLRTVFTKKLENPTEMYAIVLLLTGISVAVLVALCILLVIRRHLISREKLHGITRPDTEASKDYQDLCRSRMSGKNQPTETVHGRITSLSRESEQSPSSRSSTSSWSEEPALHNMDISTGHMVLSYMEDHLKNKDRLEQEWAALCVYEAEPCSSSVALKKENLEKNRYKDILPYDHARVVLNDLSNASGSDYINASSITDHDPRNPAYIAAQGPLPHTAPDFWQLIWEQGAVVIVMLTRLTEGGTAMCHRYWPEEGSELYHVYEVHLVSEHIWCDDYLVRSFYLKNTRTGETRTVTQFHFLSWPESGIPASTKALLEFRRKVNKSYRGRSCPIVVHCSDGAGRTGTYCLIDMVLSRMAKGAKEIDIAATLEHLRDQRPRMVATKQQFEFVLTAVAEEVHAILKALPPQPTPGIQQDKDK